MRQLKIGLIGLGAIGKVVAQKLTEADALFGELCAVLVRPHRAQEARNLLGSKIYITTDVSQFLLCDFDTAVEVAGQQAVVDYAALILAAGRDFCTISTGALADPLILECVLTATETGKRNLIVIPGAIAGLDGLISLREAGLHRVRYISVKPPQAWNGTPGETILQTIGAENRITLFSGDARNAALNYPKNANLSATIALMGLGFERTEVELISDPHVNGNEGRIEAWSAVGSLSLVMSGSAALDNAKTSEITAYSVLATLRNKLLSVRLLY